MLHHSTKKERQSVLLFRITGRFVLSTAVRVSLAGAAETPSARRGSLFSLGQTSNVKCFPRSGEQGGERPVSTPRKTKNPCRRGKKAVHTRNLTHRIKGKVIYVKMQGHNTTRYTKESEYKLVFARRILYNRIVVRRYAVVYGG